MGIAVALSSLLVLLLLLWSTQASARRTDEPGTPPRPRTPVQQTVRIEFVYDPESTDREGFAAAAVQFADMVSETTGLVVEGLVFPC